MTHENAGIFEPPEGWSYSLKRHASHACGATFVAPWDNPARLQWEVEQHRQACSWPEPPEPVETPTG